MADAVTYRFSDEKNAGLKAGRGVGFDDVIFALENEGLLDVVDNAPSQYPSKHMYVVEIGGYAYVVPFVAHAEKKEVFLRTIYPSRKMTRLYLRKEAQ